MELEEEKKAQAEREKRLQEQAKKIENLSSMVLYSNRDENRDQPKKGNRRDTWCFGNLSRETLGKVNLKYLGRFVFYTNGILYPDSVVETDSHTTMIAGLGVAGWGVGGIESEATMLGQGGNDFEIYDSERTVGHTGQLYISASYCIIKYHGFFYFHGI